MLPDRVYNPKEKEIIYLYCDVNSFHSICTTKRIRLTDLFSMNDFLEIHWGYNIWIEVANILIGELGKEFIDMVDQCIHDSGKYGITVAACFSLNGDVLSQWRAYADDGKGFVIGFSAKDLLNLPITPLKVLYDKNKQIDELRKSILSLYNSENNKNNKYSGDFKTQCYLLSAELASFKNPAFIEEMEIRLIHLLDFVPSNNFLRLLDAGGFYFGQERVGNKVTHRVKKKTLTAYIEEDFTNNGKMNPIKEVIIGPRNMMMDSAVAVYLETEGIGSVKISRSVASYR